MKTAVIIGSGAGGAMAAAELQGTFEVTVLEAGAPFKPLTMSLKNLELFRRAGLMFDERLIRLLFPSMNVRKTSDNMALVYGVATGGTTTLATGNALRIDKDLKELGLDLSPEFDELTREIPQTTEHRAHWSPLTEQLFDVFSNLNMNPQPLPKMMDASRCVNCGQCVLGCRYGAKWDSRQLLERALKKGATLMTGCRVLCVESKGGKAEAVTYRKGGALHTMHADLIVLAAGGLGTPVILENSGISCVPRLFVDPVLCVAARFEGAGLDTQLPMPFAAQRERYILSPYFDYLSFYFNKRWRLSSQHIISIMIKLADDCQGASTPAGIDKPLTKTDHRILETAKEDCYAILDAVGIKRENTFLGTLNAGHPGGMLPLTAHDVRTLHPEALPEHLYLADATLFPDSLGNPPILTIMALAKRVAKTALEACG